LKTENVRLNGLLNNANAQVASLGSKIKEVQEENHKLQQVYGQNLAEKEQLTNSLTYLSAHIKSLEAEFK